MRPCTRVSVYAHVFLCTCASVCVFGGPQAWTGVETRQAFWAELWAPECEGGVWSPPIPLRPGKHPESWKEKAAMPLPAAAGKLGWVPSGGRVGTCVEERQDRGGRSPRPDHQHAWDPGQETGFISHDLSQQLDVTSCFCPFQALPAPQVSSVGVLTPLQVFQVVVALAAPLCISLTSMPMALGTSAVQAWLSLGPGHLCCVGLASPWPWACPLSRPGFPVALGTSAVRA